jgi:hypothetical protein
MLHKKYTQVGNKKQSKNQKFTIEFHRINYNGKHRFLKVEQKKGKLRIIRLYCYVDDWARSRKRPKAALSRYDKARSAIKYRAKRRGSPAAFGIFQRECPSINLYK